MNIRWILFWIKDFVEGSYIRKAYNEMKKNYLKEIDNSEQLNILLQKATENVEFYSAQGGGNITQFPIINKTTIRQNYNQFISSKYNKETLHKMSTSGSTGTPFTILQNKEKRKRVIAEILFFNDLIGYQFGEKQVHFRVWNEKIKKSRWEKMLLNMVTIDISNINDNNLKEIVAYMKKDTRLSNMLCYANFLDKLTYYMEKNNCKPEEFSIKTIVAGAEILNDNTRKRAKKIFGCSPVSRYSNQENGLIAQEINEKEYYINYTDYYVEFLKLDSDEPAQEGELARIVITDLYNYAMPMIRYDIGDIAIFENKIVNNEKVRVIKKLYGRKIDLIYNTKSEPLSPYIITGSMWGETAIKQFKFIQFGKKEYKLILNSETEVDKQYFINKFREKLGNDANIEVEQVTEIPVLQSGKFKCIENLMK